MCSHVYLSVFNYAYPAHTMKRTLLNTLEVAHPSTPMSKHVHSHFGSRQAVCLAHVPASLKELCSEMVSVVKASFLVHSDF